MSIENFKKAISKAGTQTALAEKIPNGKQTTIAQWIARGWVPPERVIDVCAAINYQVTPHEIRPDIYPHPDDALPDSMRCSCNEDAD